MARPKEFDPDVALARAIEAFRARSYESVTTADLCQAMGIGRQSMYDTFGDKASLYLLALESYRDAGAATSEAYCQQSSALDGLEALFAEIAGAPHEERRAGCMLVNAVGELAASDPDVAKIASDNQTRLLRLFADTVRRGQVQGDIAQAINPGEASARLLATFYGLRVMAKADPSSGAVAQTARTAVDFLRPT